MPIRGVTDTARPSFPSLGKLRKGGPKGEKRPGEELDHWRFTSDNPAIVQAFHNYYGPEPREIDVLLPYALIEDNFSSWKEHWVAGGLQHRCDGETCTIWLTDEGKYSDKPVPCPGQCKEVGRLALILPPLIRAGFVGYVTLETHSINDIIAIQSALLATKEHRGHEDMRGILFVLRRVEEAISTPGANGRRVRRKKWMVRLEPAAEWVRGQIAMVRQKAMLPMGTMAEEAIDSVAREIPHEQKRASNPRAESTPKAETPAEPNESESTQSATPPTQSPPSDDGFLQRLKDSFSKYFYTRWVRYYPDDTDHSRAHEEWGCKSIKDLEVGDNKAATRVSPALNILEWGRGLELSDKDMKAGLGITLWKDWPGTRQEGIDRIAAHIGEADDGSTD